MMTGLYLRHRWGAAKLMLALLADGDPLASGLAALVPAIAGYTLVPRGQVFQGQDDGPERCK